MFSNIIKMGGFVYHFRYNLAQQEQYAQVLEELRKHLPSFNAAWDKNASRGAGYNQFFLDLFERTRSDR